MKLRVKVNPDNKYRNELWFGDRMIANGNNGLESVELVSNGKRSMVVLQLAPEAISTSIQITRCPEKYRFSEIEKALGDRTTIDSLNSGCDLLRMSPNACIGCICNPNPRSQEERGCAIASD